MANSGKSPPKSEAAGQTDAPTLIRNAVERLLDRFVSSPATTIAVAYSGGVDSTVLLHVLAGLRSAQADNTHSCEARSDASPADAAPTDEAPADDPQPDRTQPGSRFTLVALHVHHGLSPHADDWLEHCATQCRDLGVAFDHARVAVEPHPGQSLEAMARDARYGALETLCRKHGARWLMSAHHADDQAETVLLNLLRGAGVAGLSGMAASRPLGRSEDRNSTDAGVMLCRPFLQIAGSLLRNHAQATGLCWIEDESNQTLRFTRNALRHRVMPAIRDIAPDAAQRLTQTALHAAQAQDLLTELGHEDLHRMQRADNRLSLAVLQTLSPARAANALRTWLDDNELYRPSTAALQDMLDQLLHAAPDAQTRLNTQGWEMRVYRGMIHLHPAPTVRPPPSALRWAGEDALDLPAWDGRLVFEPAASGLPAARLRTESLAIRGRRGGERLKLHPAQPSRTLKNLYQERGIPAWQRERLPLVFADGQLIYAGGLGMDVRALSPGRGEACIALRWEIR